MGVAARWPMEAPGEWTAAHEVIRLQTAAPMAFVDITDRVATLVARHALETGVVHIQTRHTTTGVIINEHEPLLLDDLRQTLEQLAPRGRPYAHDDFSRRTVNIAPGERVNGHAHCQALVLRASESVNVADGELCLGRWQRVFFVELDGAQCREVSVAVMGLASGRRRPRKADGGRVHRLQNAGVRITRKV